MGANARSDRVLRTDHGRLNYSYLHTFAAMSKTQTAEEAVELNPDFTFDLSGDPYTDFRDEHLDVQDLVKKGSKPVCYPRVCATGVWLLTSA